MTVHIDELHSEVAPVNSGRPVEASDRRSPEWFADESWAASYERLRWVEARTKAEDFSD